MDFTAKISNMMKICESDQNVEFRLKVRKMIKIWNSDRNMEFCSNFQCPSNHDHAIERAFRSGLQPLLRGQSFLRLLHESESCVELVYSKYDLYTI